MNSKSKSKSKKKHPSQMSTEEKLRLMAVNPYLWALWARIDLGGFLFTGKGHEYQRDMMVDEAKTQVIMKGAQLGITQIEVLRVLHGLIVGKYPKGVLYLFPTRDDVSDFSKGRFQPLIESNPEFIGNFVKSTDATNIKRIGQGLLYLRGAKVAQKIGGVKKTASQLKSIPVDSIRFDEYDEMDQEMIELAKYRISHSDVGELIKLGTPSIPDWGIHKEYLASDQKKWFLKCEACNEWTCLEEEFPECIKIDGEGKAHRVCKKCGKDLVLGNGQWVKAIQDAEISGYHISQLNSPKVDPRIILEEYTDPPNGNYSEIYNSRLGLPYIAAENRLNEGQIYSLCRNEPAPYKSEGPCAMGVDVGRLLHVVVASKVTESIIDVEYIASVSSFSDVHDIAKRFNVRSAVVDYKPEIHKARRFQEEEDYEVFLCEYRFHQRGEAEFDEGKGFVTVNRSEICDDTYDKVVTPGCFRLPRRSEVVNEYARQMCNTAKVLEEQPDGSKIYKYIKLGDDHFYHATNYLLLALSRIGLKRSSLGRLRPWLMRIRKRKSWMAR